MITSNINQKKHKKNRIRVTLKLNWLQAMQVKSSCKILIRILSYTEQIIPIKINPTSAAAIPCRIYLHLYNSMVGGGYESINSRHIIRCYCFRTNMYRIIQIQYNSCLQLIIKKFLQNYSFIFNCINHKAKVSLKLFLIINSDQNIFSILKLIYQKLKDIVSYQSSSRINLSMISTILDDFEAKISIMTQLTKELSSQILNDSHLLFILQLFTLQHYLYIHPIKYIFNEEVIGLDFSPGKIYSNIFTRYLTSAIKNSKVQLNFRCMPLYVIIIKYFFLLNILHHPLNPAHNFGIFYNKIKKEMSRICGIDTSGHTKSPKRPLAHLIDQSYSDDYFSTPKKKVKAQTHFTKPTSQNFYQTIEHVPIVQLTPQQMKSDPIALMIQLEKKYEKFGAVVLRTPENWNPPYTFRYIDKGITTRVQCLQKLKTGKAFQQNIQAYSIRQFENFALDFEKKYKLKTNPSGKTHQAQLQLEYWNLVSDKKSASYNTKQVVVEYAADLPVSRYGSGFPLSKQNNWPNQAYNYEESLFNLNNIYKSPMSMMTISQERKQKVSGINIPWVYMGMQFSTFCWHVQDLWINSLNYNHKGGIKTWYVIPKCDKEKFDHYVEKNYITGIQKKTLLERITFMLDPQDLAKNNIQVYKIYQRPQDYVCTFFKAYHCGFSQSFNVGEAVNFISPLSIAVMKQSILDIESKNIKKPSVIPLQWLVYENIEAHKHTNNTKIMQYYKKILHDEYENLKKVTTKDFHIKNVQILPVKTKYDKNYCSICKNYEYLSSLKCQSCNKNYCYDHLSACCKGHYTLILRALNKDRMPLMELLPAIKKANNEFCEPSDHSKNSHNSVSQQKKQTKKSKSKSKFKV